MADSLSSAGPLGQTLRWLSLHAGFPRSRLESRAEILLLLAAAADAEASGPPGGAKVRGAMSYDRAALRAHTLNRAHTQFKSDNKSKV